MSFKRILSRVRAFDLQTKVILILVLVIFPISFFLGLVQSKVLEPVLSEEIRQVGVSFAESLANQIESRKLLLNANPSAEIEERIQRMMYIQPSIVRIDVIANRPNFLRANPLQYIASNLEEQEMATPPIDRLKETLFAEKDTEEGSPVWSIYYPVQNGSEKANIHVLASLRFVSAVQATTQKINLTAALLSTVLLTLVLSFFLRRAIENEKQLKMAQRSNEALSEKLQGIQRELIHTEKLAVMGQLTASFAHEIGTPLNAIGGHVQLLNMDLEKEVSGTEFKPIAERISIITGQLKKIEDIVKGFLQTTKKPISQQKSRVPVRDLIASVVALVGPTLQRHQISLVEDVRTSNDTIEVVPLEIEQVILNLFNNAIDSMKGGVGNFLWVRTYSEADSEKTEQTGKTGQTVTIAVQDTGTGISEANLKQIFRPFFTTKSAGEGHGLGLSICQQIVRSYGGEIWAESKLNEGTQIRVQFKRVL